MLGEPHHVWKAQASYRFANSLLQIERDYDNVITTVTLGPRGVSAVEKADRPLRVGICRGSRDFQRCGVRLVAGQDSADSVEKLVFSRGVSSSAI